MIIETCKTMVLFPNYWNTGPPNGCSCVHQPASLPFPAEGSTVGKAMRNVRAHVQDPGQCHGVDDQPFSKKGWVHDAYMEF